MNHLLVSLSLISLLISCSPTSQPAQQATEKLTEETSVEKPFACEEMEYASNQAQADSMMKYYENAKAADSASKLMWEHKLFCAFPNSFEGMEQLFAFDDESIGPPYKYDPEKEAAPLYHSDMINGIIPYFGQLSSIPSEAYYNKYIDININGNWQADNISDAFGFHKRLLNDTEAACAVLGLRPVDEVKSVFHFIFDGPHPDNDHNKAIYKELLPKVTAASERLGNLLAATYDEMLAEDHSH